MKILITGISGFVGTYLAEAFIEQGHEVFGVDRTERSGDAGKRFKNKARVHIGDLCDFEKTRNILDLIRPDRIYHLAAKSHIGLSWASPLETYTVNINGQVNLLEAVRELGLSPQIQIAGSSEEYGIVQPSELPIQESTRLNPTSPYAVSKVTQDLMGYQYFKNYNLPIIVTRAFNQTGPRRSDLYVTSAFAKQVAQIMEGVCEPVVTAGNLDAIRDFTDVRDAVRAYCLVMDKGLAGEVYNICSGQGVRIGDILDILKKISGTEFEIQIDPKRKRPSDLPALIGDNGKLRNQTGWNPEISFEDSMKDLLEYWRAKIVQESRT